MATTDDWEYTIVILRALRDIKEHSDSDTSSKAYSLLSCYLQEKNTVLLLLTSVKKVFHLTPLSFSTLLQSITIDFVNLVHFLKHADSLKKEVSDMRANNEA